MKLNLGSGGHELSGYVNLDGAKGDTIHPLFWGGESPEEPITEIRASHVLEHFGRAEGIEALRGWTRHLAPGGVLKIAVPDFKWIAEKYLAGADIPVQGYVMGGQVDARDFHKTIFDEEGLAELLRDAGLVDIGRWASDAPDCSSLPVSLNLQGTKPLPRGQGGEMAGLRVSGVMSVPRLGFMDNFNCAGKVMLAAGIPFRPFFGAFWGRVMTGAIETTIEEDDPDAILAMDYDTVFGRGDVEALVGLMARHREADAIAPMQASRHEDRNMVTLDLPPGVSHDAVPDEVFAGELTPIRTAHFGLTLLRVAALRKLPRPWFRGVPDAEGRWGPGSVDDDIWFWRQWQAAGFKLCQANGIVIGHLELMVRWPGAEGNVINQIAREWRNEGKPKGTWA